MALNCAASAKLALPSVLRSVFRSQLICDLRSSPARRCSRSLRQPQHPRPFASTTRFLQSQSDATVSITPESHPSSPSETSTPQPASSDLIAPARQGQSKGAKPRPANKAKKTQPQTEIETETKEPKDRKLSDKDRKHEKAKKEPKKPKKPEAWEIQKDALGKKFPNGWNPAKRLSPDALDGIRHLHATAPDRFTTAVLADEFKVSPEAIRRILRSKWRPSEGEIEKRRVRWENRHERIWSQMAELGLRPSTNRSQPLSDSRGLYEPKKK